MGVFRLLLGWLVLSLLGCVSPAEESQILRIRIVNSATGLDIRVVVDGPRFDAVTVDVASGGTQTVYPRGDDGDIVSFTATVPTNPSVSGSGSCTAGPEMSPGSEGDVHGQVNLILSSAAVITVECSGAGLPGGGWR